VTRSELEADIEEDARGVALVRWDPVRPRPTEPGVLAPVSNFGDLLGPVIVRRLLESTTEPGSEGVGRLLSVGSVLHFARPGDTVWGSGVNGKIPLGELLDAGRLDVRATRGPYSAAALARNGHVVPSVHGDPALLLPELFPEVAEWATRKRRGTTIVPNMHDHAAVAADERTIDPQADLWSVVRAIAESEFVVGSSLHGVIVAEALGIPARAVRSSAESVFKYDDYYAGTGRWDVELAADIADAERLGGAPPPVWDAAALRRSFPADLWGADRDLAATGTSWDGHATAERIDERLRLGATRLTHRDVVTLATVAGAARGRAGDGVADPAVGVPGLRRRAVRGGAPMGRRVDAVVVVLDGPDDGVVGAVRSALDTTDADVLLVVTSSDPVAARAAGMLATEERVQRIDAPGLPFGDAVDVAVDVSSAERFAVLGVNARSIGLDRVLEGLDDDVPLAVGRVLQFSSTETWDASRTWHDGRDRSVTAVDWPDAIAIRSLDGLALTRSLWRRATAGGSFAPSSIARAAVDAAPRVRLVGAPAVLRRSATLDPASGPHRPGRLLLEERLRTEIPFAEAASASTPATRAAYARSFLSDRGRERLAVSLAEPWTDHLPALDVSLCGAAAHLVSVVPDGALEALPADLRAALVSLSRGDTVEARRCVAPD
jgi:pyruvyltransferase